MESLVLRKSVEEFNRNVDIVYRARCGDSRQAIAKLYKITPNHLDKIVKRFSSDPKVMEAVRMKQRAIEDFHD